MLGTRIEVIQTWNMEVEEAKEVAITFDDGPHASYTSFLLEELAKRDVVVTFFVTGEHAAEAKDLIAKMTEDSHLIGNHTYSHMQLTDSNLEEFKQELLATSQVIYEITGTTTQYVRPPYGVWDESIEEELDMIPVFWTIDPLDWCSDDPVAIAQTVLKEVEDGDIILLHDSFESSVEAALIIIDELLARGYNLVTVEDIIME